MSFFKQQLRRVIDLSAESGADWCITLESKLDSDNWVQFTFDRVNMHYPKEEDPQTALQYPECLQLDDWQADTYVTFEYPGDSAVDEVAEFVLGYVQTVLKHEPGDSEWSTDEFQL